jgi:hypothetical protein
MAFIELVDREGEAPANPSAKGKKNVEGTTKKKAADQKTKNLTKDKKATKAPTTKTAGKKSDGEKKKVTQAAKKKTVDEKLKSE